MTFKKILYLKRTLHTICFSPTSLSWNDTQTGNDVPLTKGATLRKAQEVYVCTSVWVYVCIYIYAHAFIWKRMFMEFKTCSIKTLIEAIILDRDTESMSLSPCFVTYFLINVYNPSISNIKFDSEYQFGTDFSDTSCESSCETLSVKFCRFPQKQIYIFIDNIPRKLKSP